MEEIQLLSEETIFCIEKTTELFYEQKIREAYETLQQVINCLIKLTHVFRVKENNLKIDEIYFHDLVKNLMDSLCEKDVISITDILEYELKALLIELSNSLYK